jgi:hypothetical protein
MNLHKVKKKGKGIMPMFSWGIEESSLRLVLVGATTQRYRSLLIRTRIKCSMADIHSSLRTGGFQYRIHLFGDHHY